jgi:hypothetical protein
MVAVVLAGVSIGMFPHQLHEVSFASARCVCRTCRETAVLRCKFVVQGPTPRTSPLTMRRSYTRRRCREQGVPTQRAHEYSSW